MLRNQGPVTIYQGMNNYMKSLIQILNRFPEILGYSNQINSIITY